MSKAPLKNLYKFLISFIFLAGVIAHWLYIGGFPIVMHHSANTVFPAIHANDKVTSPLKDIDVTDAKAFLILSSDDWSERPEGMPARRVLVCTDAELMRQLKDNFSFEISGGDMATVESELWVYCHDTLVLMTNIDINPNNIGIQNELTGWAEAMNKEALCHLFARFRPYRAPFLSLR